MKKTSLILLLILLLLQSGGLFLLLKTEQFAAKFAQQQLINRRFNKSESMTMATTDLKKCKVNEKEFVRHGEMYDILSCYINGDSTVMQVILDKREGEVFKKIRKYLKHQNHTEPPTYLQQLIQLFYLPSKTEYAAKKDFCISIPYKELICNLVFQTSEVLIPPPKV